MALFNYECDEVKRKIEEVSPNYPQLTTYEKEWLFFHKYHYIPGVPVELEYNTVNVSPYGSVSNAIPFQYKSAILKGNSLVNLLTNKYSQCNLPTSQDVVIDGANTTQDSSEYRIKQINLKTPLTVGKVYLIAINVKSMENVNYIGVYTYDGTKTDYPQELRPSKIGLNVVKYTAKRPILQIAYYVDGGNGKRATFGQPMIIEYQEGMENWDIPYFDGMASVRMPVLTTSNEDGTKTNILTANEEVELRGIDDVRDELNLLTGELTQHVEEIVLDGSEVWSSNALLGNGIMVYMCQTYTNGKNVTNNLICPILPCYKLDYLKGLATLDGLPNAFITTTTSTGKINIAFKTPFSDINQLKLWLSQNPITVQYQLAEPIVKTVDLTSLNKPYEGTNRYQLTSNIPCEAILEVPVVSTGEQTLEEINNY